MRGHDEEDELAEAYHRFVDLAKRIIMHEYMMSFHEVQMLEWTVYNRIKGVLRVLAGRHPDSMPYAREIISNKDNFDGQVASAIFYEDWPTVRRTLDLVAAEADSDPYATWPIT